jgi:hypothetical protein
MLLCSQTNHSVVDLWWLLFYDCRAYSSGTHARKDEDGLLLEFPCNPTRTRAV